MSISERLDSQIRELQALRELVEPPAPKPKRAPRTKAQPMQAPVTQQQQYYAQQAIAQQAPVPQAKPKRPMTQRQLESLQKGREKRIQMLSRQVLTPAAAARSQPINIRSNERVYF